MNLEPIIVQLNEITENPICQQFVDGIRCEARLEFHVHLKLGEVKKDIFNISNVDVTPRLFTYCPECKILKAYND